MVLGLAVLFIIMFTATMSTSSISAGLGLGGGTISGHLYRSDGVTPIANEEIYLNDSSGSYIRSGVSDQTGYYSFTDLQAGGYYLNTAGQAGMYYSNTHGQDSFIWETYNNAYRIEDATMIMVEENGHTENADWLLDLGGRIEGRITGGAENKPLDGVDVVVIHVETGRDHHFYTDENGEFSCCSLRTGTYLLGAGRFRQEDNFLTTWYDNVLAQEDAIPIQLTAPDILTGYNIVLREAAITGISGHVYAAEGNTPILKNEMFIFNSDWTWSRVIETDSEGLYYFSNLEPGTYYIYANNYNNYQYYYIDQYFGGSRVRENATPISVLANAVTEGIDFYLDMGGRISGTVYDAAGMMPIASTEIVIISTTGALASFMMTNPDGTYDCGGMATGEYLVSATGHMDQTGTNKQYITEWYDNAASGEQGTPVHVVAPGTTTGIDLVLDKIVPDDRVLVKLVSSNGQGLEGAVISYYDAGWKEFGITDSNGEARLVLDPKIYSFRVSYGGGTNLVSQDISLNATVVFQTTSVVVELQDSSGSLLGGGEVRYYAGGWREFGAASGGQAVRELLPNSYAFEMTYAYGKCQKKQDVQADPLVVFQTQNVRVQLKDSQGISLDTGTVRYYAGGWREFGTTSGGEAGKELLPGSYAFEMAFEGASVQKSQDIGLQPIVVFNTVLVYVHLKDSQGVPLDQGTVRYYAGGWRDFGITSGGVASKELLPKTYSFEMKFAYGANQKSQDIGSNSAVVFNTVRAMVRLKSSSGSMLDSGSVRYYAGGWREFGMTSGGEVSKELLPNSYSFEMKYAYGSTQKTQNIGAAATIEFQTGKVVSASGTCTGYYAGGWRPFNNGMELIPATFTFKFNDGTANTNHTIPLGGTITIH